MTNYDLMIRCDKPAKTLIHPTISPAPVPEYGDQSPLLPVINVYFDHENNTLDEIETILDAILAMDIDHSMDCGFMASDVWLEIDQGATQLTFCDIFTPLANDLQRLGMLAGDGHLEISAEYAAILISLGIHK